MVAIPAQIHSKRTAKILRLSHPHSPSQQQGLHMGDTAKAVLDIACSNGLKGVVVALTQDLQSKFGKLAINYGSTKQLSESVTPATDVVIMSDGAIDGLIAASTLAPQRLDIARSRIGLAVRTGAPRPDIST